MRVLLSLEAHKISEASRSPLVGCPPLLAKDQKDEQACLARRGEVVTPFTDVCYGVVRAARADSDELEYFAAMRVPSSVGPPAAGMSRVEISQATYAVFEHRGAAEAVDRTVSYAYSTWLLQHGRRHTGGPDLEIYDARYHATAESSVFSYAIPVAVRSERG
jgi:AraC family transcriptional regulator